MSGMEFSGTDTQHTAGAGLREDRGRTPSRRLLAD